MRRYLVLLSLLLLTLPVGFSIIGCGTRSNEKFCNQAGFGQTVSAIDSIHLDPELTGESLHYGQTGQLPTPTAANCQGGAIAVGNYDYTTSNQALADVSPTGQLCAGTWNRNTGGGIPAFSTCLPATQAGVAYVTADAGGKSSNQVAVYVHPVVTSLSLNVTNTQTGVSSAAGDGQTGCFSQGDTAQLNATAFVEGSATTPFCAPNSGNPAVPDCTVNLGHLAYSPITTSVVTIDQNGLATAQLPGSTVVSATIAGTSSNAGYFSTCPPKAISIAGVGGSSNVSVTPNTPQAINAQITDTNGKTITGLSLSFTSTNPQNIAVTGGGSVSSTFPSASAVYAVCQPPACNPAPINQIGVNGNGAPVVSNSVGISSPGNVSSFVWMASPLSQYFEPVDLTTGTTGTPVRLPYFPNSMVLDQSGTSLYFGSYHELMVYTASSNTLSNEDATVPGVVLAVSPDNNTVVINDLSRQVVYLYTPSNKTITTTFGAVAQRAVFSPDSATVYLVGQVAGQPALLIHNVFTGWTVDPLPAGTGNPVAACKLNPATPGNTPGDNGANSAYNFYCSPDVALTVPSVAAVVSGTATTAFGFCPDTRQSPVTNYPQAATIAVTNDHLATTTDGKHLLGATADPPVLTDTTLNVPATSCPLATVTRPGGAVVTGTVPLVLPATPNAPVALTGYGIQNIDQVVASPDSSIAFVTYTGTATATPPGGALLPAYKPSATTGALGTLSNVVLSGSATAPLIGLFSTDYQSFFVGTAGDNLLHIISVPTLKDVRQIAPKLPDANGNTTPVQLLAARPRPTT